MNDKIIIIGGKGTAVVIAEQILDAKENFNMNIDFLGFAFDDPSFGSEINGFPILGKSAEIFEKYKGDEDVKFIFQLYRPDLLKERIALKESLGIPKNRYYTFVHPSAFVSKSANIGVGSIILAHCVINCNVKIGEFNTINSSALIGHDTILGDYNFIAGHTCIGSGLSIGFGNFFGLNSSYRNMIRIGDYNFFGMAANVVKEVNSSMFMLGNPAKAVKKEKK